VQERYNFENVKKWGKKITGKDIFKLKNLFIPINTNNTHWTLVVITFEEKWIKYYDSIANNTGNSQLNNILQFLMDSDEERK
jgi:Ulp1 family protease